jgi:hypothetical protein
MNSETDHMTVRRLLEEDHARLDALLDAAAGAANGPIDMVAYGMFRVGLLRHIGMEERILLPAARRLRGGAPVERAGQLRLDHAALAALLVPTPTFELVARLRSLLALHNPLEEGPAGVYAECEALIGADQPDLLTRLQGAPEVPPAAHFDGPRAFAAIDRLLRAAKRDV